MLWNGDLGIDSAAVAFIPKYRKDAIIRLLCAQQVHQICVLVSSQSIGPARDVFAVGMEPHVVVLSEFQQEGCELNSRTLKANFGTETGDRTHLVTTVNMLKQYHTAEYLIFSPISHEIGHTVWILLDVCV